ncbi:OB-fold nucleic acid binding domain-containing protein [Leuconostoc fallax]
MAFVNISDTSGSLSVTVFPNLYQKVQDILKVGQIILISGKTETTRQVSLIAQQLNLAPKPTVSKTSSRTWFLQFDAQHDNDDNKRRVSDVLKKHHGPIPVVVHWQNTGKSSQLEQKYWLSDETGIIRDLAPLLGADNIIFRR